MRISDWSSDVCSSELVVIVGCGADDAGTVCWIAVAAAADLVGDAQVLDGRTFVVCLEASHQDIANGFVAVGGYADAVALAHEGEDRPGGDIGLAGPRRPLDRQHGGVHGRDAELGRASGRERVCQYVSIWVDGVALNKKTKQ